MRLLSSLRFIALATTVALSSSSGIAAETPPALDDLEAMTVVALGGAGVTRITFKAAPDSTGELVVRLPPGARAWKVWIGSNAQSLVSVVRGDAVRLPLKHAAQIEIAYTFNAPPLGMRGRYHFSLPAFSHPVRDARWDVWLPQGLRYGKAQASLAPSECGRLGAETRTPLNATGQCLGFAGAVLEPRPAFVEGAYDQPL